MSNWMTTKKSSVCCAVIFFLLSTVISQVPDNPDGTCTNVMIYQFKTIEEFNSFIAESDDPNTVNNPGIRYNISTDNNALCLDGTNGVFYYRPGYGAGKTKYQIYMEGGGSCHSINDCEYRSQTYLGSTTNDTKYAYYSSEFLSANQEQNPLTFNWNTIFLRYCDGSSFSGNNASETITNGQPLYFGGYHILTNAFQYLWDSFGLSQATDVILSGCSAGGEATYYHTDYILDTFVGRSATFMSIPESGFFLASPNSTSDASQKQMFILHNMTIGMNQECISKYNSNEYYLCSYAQYTMPYIKSKTFALQSKFDLAFLGSADYFDYNMSAINEWGNEVVNTFLNEYINGGVHHNNHGAYFDSCSHHCGEFNHIIIDGYVSSNAMYQFYHFGEDNHNRLWFQNSTYPCALCCFPDNHTIAPNCVDPHN